MKKIFAVIILLMAVFTANAQKVYTHKPILIGNGFDWVPTTVLKIGEYEAEGERTYRNHDVCIEKNGKRYFLYTTFVFKFKDADEAFYFEEFVNENKEKLGEKLGLIFTDNAKFYSGGIVRDNYEVRVYAITHEEKALIDKEESRKAEAMEMAKVERENRMNNLASILD